MKLFGTDGVRGKSWRIFRCNYCTKLAKQSWYLFLENIQQLREFLLVKIQEEVVI